jgi:EAL domain-containing protein (putative c-di-GMP-specific phosphodiesterase class I)
LIGGIGEWVIQEACRQAAEWRDLSAPHPSVPVSVNISAYQLASTGLPGVVQEALNRRQLESELLMLEVTEAALLQDMSSAQRELARLKSLGVRLIVDDFGAGYSSLPALRELMIDGLKLDRSFVQALVPEEGADDDSAMVGAVLGMANALDAHVTAEGVETWAQVSRLREHGCDYAQGYLFARPRPAGDLTPMLLRGSAREAPAGFGAAPEAVPAAEPDGLAPAQG